MSGSELNKFYYHRFSYKIIFEVSYYQKVEKREKPKGFRNCIRNAFTPTHFFIFCKIT